MLKHSRNMTKCFVKEEPLSACIRQTEKGFNDMLSQKFKNASHQQCDI
jgi:hypothetical protein